MSGDGSANQEGEPTGAQAQIDGLEAMGLTPDALAAAIGRAKIKAQRQQKRRCRPKLNTNPELDKWFD